MSRTRSTLERANVSDVLQSVFNGPPKIREKEEKEATYMHTHTHKSPILISRSVSSVLFS